MLFVNLRNFQQTPQFVLPSTRKGINLTVILLAATAGLIVIAILVAVLWKVGPKERYIHSDLKITCLLSYLLSDLFVISFISG